MVSGPRVWGLGSRCFGASRFLSSFFIIRVPFFLLLGVDKGSPKRKRAEGT